MRILTILLFISIILSQPVGFGGFGDQKSVLGSSDGISIIPMEQEIKEQELQSELQVRFSSRSVNTSNVNQAFQNTSSHRKARNRQNRYSAENSQRQGIHDSQQHISTNTDVLRQQAANAYRTQRASNLYKQPTPPSYLEELFTIVMVL